MEDLSLKSYNSGTTVTGTGTDSVIFAEDRSDKSQYITNTVMQVHITQPVSEFKRPKYHIYLHPSTPVTSTMAY